MTSSNGEFILNKTKHFQTTSDKATNNVWSLYQDRSKRYWIGTHGGGLLLMHLPDNATNVSDANNWEPHLHKYLAEDKYANSLASNAIQVITQDNFDNIWIGSTNGLYRIEGNMIPDSHSKTQVPIKFESHFNIPGDQSKIVGNNIMDILEDEQGMIWVATTNGLSQYNWYSNQFKSFSFPNAYQELSSTSNIIVDKKQNIWFGFSNGKLGKFKITKDKLIQVNKNQKLRLGNSITSIYSPDDIWLYAGTNNGIVALNMNTDEIRRYPLVDQYSSNKNFTISSIYVDKNKVIWAGSKVGLYKINFKTKDYEVFEPIANDPYSISDYPINHITEDRKGDIWVATYKGLNRIHKKEDGAITFEKYFFDASEPSKGPITNEITYLKEIDQYLYIGTILGLCRYNYLTAEFESFDNAAQKYWVRSIEEGLNNNVWISTNEGLFHYDVNRNSFRGFDNNDGLKRTSFIQGSSFKDDSKQIYFATRNGFTYFQPEELKSNKTPPPVFITGIEKMTKDGNALDEGIQSNRITLDPNTYRISINYAILNYNRADKNKFEYKLVGLDEQWNKGKLGTPIVYTSLKAKDYELKLRAANNDGVWNFNGTSLAITQNAPYWEVWWFRLMVLLLISSLIFYTAYWYTNKIRKHNEALQNYNTSLNEEIANRKSIEQSLNSNNKELKRSNKELEQFAYVSSHDLKEPLRTIGNFSSLLTHKYGNKLDADAKEYFKFIGNGVSRMYKVIDSLLTYSTVGGQDSIYSTGLPQNSGQ